MKKLKENVKGLAVWIAIFLTAAGMVYTWSSDNINKNNKQDVDIAVLNTNLQNISAQLKSIEAKIDAHMAKEVKP